jgi:UDP-glucose 4-epimerase
MADILVTGGAGYIGSHTTVALLNAGYNVTVVDDLSNSDRAVVEGIRLICGRDIEFVEGDIRNQHLLHDILTSKRFLGVMHFAGLKAVEESVRHPLKYFDNNVGGPVSLLRAMKLANIKLLVFSSSATVYGDAPNVPITENFSRSPTNPYGRSKLIVEDILNDLHSSCCDWRIACLRYFNPVGAHESGMIGEDPRGVPQNLVPIISQVAAGRCDRLKVYGGDYPTLDGTCIRDYIHVMDLAEGHAAALAYLENHAGVLTLNLGTGRGVSVLGMVAAFEKASGRCVPYQIIERRQGDVGKCWASIERASSLLSWMPKRSIEDMCADAWRWQLNNLRSYKQAA